MRHQLLPRLLAGSILVAICSITATAWLTVRSTTTSIEREQDRTLADDTKIYDTLLGYAATHKNWDGLQDGFADLVRKYDRRIAVVSASGVRLGDSAAPGTALPQRPTAVLNPLEVDVSIGTVPADRIDPRAVAPYGLPAAEQAIILKETEAVARCLIANGRDARIVRGLSGRPTVVSADGFGAVCPSPPKGNLLASENKALGKLTKAVDECLVRRGQGEVELEIGGRWIPLDRSNEPDPHAVQSCLISSRKAQLKPHVAAPALLYLGGGGTAASAIKADLRDVTAAAGLVLLLTVGGSVLLGTRMIHPLRALTGAAQDMRAGDRSTRVKITDRGEVGRLGTAFNEMSEHLEVLENQRKALISDISHELRTPLSNLRGWLEAAQDGVAELDHRILAALVDEILLLQHIVGDLQDLAQADAGALRLRPEMLDLADVLLHIAATNPKVDARTEGPCPLIADPVRIRQILGNLVSNAVRHTTGRVTLHATRHDGRIVISVHNPGPPIPSEDLPHVFDRFWRADRSRTRQTGGSGLGLAIVRSLAEAHQGTATATSGPDGTTFTLHLPDPEPH